MDKENIFDKADIGYLKSCCHIAIDHIYDCKDRLLDLVYRANKEGKEVKPGIHDSIKKCDMWIDENKKVMEKLDKLDALLRKENQNG